MGVSKWWNSRKADRQRKARDLDKILRKRYHSQESLFGETWTDFRIRHTANFRDRKYRRKKKRNSLI